MYIYGGKAQADGSRVCVLIYMLEMLTGVVAEFVYNCV
jgi:hypothetical protein